MSILKIRKAQREGARVVIGLAGVSGSGKTYTALKLAQGLAKGKAGKVGLLDTENRRGSLYADILGEPFLIGDLLPPFSPERYVEAIREFADAGVDVLVVDSMSHEWEGTGGCDDIAQAERNPVVGWKKAKLAHKSMMNALLQSPMDVIVCLRAREKVDFSDPKAPRSLGVQPICEKNFLFEMTASLLMEQSGERQTVLKCPADLVSILGRGHGFLSESDGADIRHWIDGGKPVSASLKRARDVLEASCEQGIAALKSAWEATPATVKKQLGGTTFLESLKSSAEAFDLASKPDRVPSSVAQFQQEVEDGGI